MSNWSGFGGLDLSSVQESNTYQRLQPGEYTVKCTEAKVEQIEGTNNRKLVCDFTDTGGSGDIRVNFNIFHSSAQAMEIGQRQLKSFLVAAGHKNPDKPGDVKSIIGLTCKVTVGMGKPWRDKNGVEKQSTEVKRYLAAAGAAKAAGGAEAMDDDIPF